MRADIDCIRPDLQLEVSHEVLEGSNQLFVVNLVHQRDVALENLVNSWSDVLYRFFNAQYLLKGACSIESDWNGLVVRHVEGNTLADLLNMVIVSDVEVSIDTVGLAGSQPHERLFTLELRHNIGHQHLLNLALYVLLSTNLCLKGSNAIHEGLFDSPVSSLWAIDG